MTAFAATDNALQLCYKGCAKTLTPLGPDGTPSSKLPTEIIKRRQENVASGYSNSTGRTIMGDASESNVDTEDSEYSFIDDKLPRGVYYKCHFAYRASHLWMTKTFPVKIHGDADGKRLAAEQKARWEIEYPTVDRDLPEGVYFDVVSESYKASHLYHGKFKTKTYSIKKYGQADAKRLASEQIWAIEYSLVDQGLPNGVSHESNDFYRASHVYNGKRMSKTFSVKAHGETDSIRLASEQKAQWVAEFPSNDGSLPKGVYYSRSHNSYRASHLFNGKRMTKGFAVKRHGEEEAMQLASEQKAQWEAEFSTLERGLPKGVYFDKSSDSYKAHRSCDGKRTTKAFTVKKHGDGDAKRLALQQIARWNTAK